MPRSARLALVLLSPLLAACPAEGDDSGSSDTGLTGSTTTASSSDSSSTSSTQGSGSSSTGTTTSSTEATSGIHETGVGTDTTTTTGTGGDGGFVTAQIIARGSETLLVGDQPGGSDLTGTAVQVPGFEVTSLSLNGDGSLLWVTVYDPYQDKAPQWQIWAIPTAGGLAQQSDVTIPERWGYPGGVQIRTGDGGGPTMLNWPYAIGSTSFPKRKHAFLSSPGPGEPFVQVATSEDPPMDTASFGLAEYTWPRATSDGQGLIMLERDTVWAVTAGNAWLPVALGERDSIRWNGDPPPSNAKFGGLDIDAAGAKWLTTLQLAEDPDRDAVLTGTGPTSTTIEGLWDMASAGHTVGLDDLGEVVAYTTTGPMFGEAHSWVGAQGGEHREIDVEVDYATEIALSDDGRQLHVVNAISGMGHATTSFFESTSGDGRIKAHTETFGGTGLFGVELSKNGSVYAARVDIDPSHAVSFFGAMVGHREHIVEGAPTSEQIRFRIDDAEDKLIIRCTATATGTDEIKSVRLLPLWRRYIKPSAVHTAEHDPFASWSQGAELTPADDGSGDYEAQLALDGKAGLLDAAWSIRVVVNSGPVDGTTNRASYYDFVPVARTP